MKSLLNRRRIWAVVMCMLFVTMVSPHIRADLVHHWTLDENVGGTAVDAVAGGHNGTIGAGITVAPGVVGNAFHFDGTTNAHITLANFSTANIKSMTIAFWMNPETGSVSAPNGQYPRVISGHDGWEAMMQADGSSDSGKLGNNFYRTGGKEGYPLTTSPLVADEWVHVVMTSALGTAAAPGLMEIYINGELDKSLAAAQNDWAGGELRIGHRPGMAANQHFKGLLDDIRIYSTVLSASEIRSLYSSAFAASVPIYPMPLPDPLGKNVPADMTFEWTFESGSDVQLRDYILYMGTSEADVRNGSGGGLLINGVTVLPTALPDPAAQKAYNGIAQDTTYYWRVDTRIYEPNGVVPDLYDIPKTISGAVWSFMGVLPVPVIQQHPVTVYLLPDPDTHAFMPIESPSFSMAFEAGKPVVSVKWFRNGFECIGSAFQIDNSLDGVAKTSTLTINIDTAAPGFGAIYAGDYHCEIVLDNTESAATAAAHLYISDAILAHRWSFNGELSDSIAGADAVIVDPDDQNIVLTDQEVIFGGTIALGDNQTSDDPNLHFLDLPNGIVSALGDHATFMMWYTITDPAVPNNVRVFTAGDADGSGTEAAWVYDETTSQWGWSGMTGDGPWVEIMTRDGNISYGSRGAGGVAINDGPAAGYLNQEICVAGVWDGSAGQIRLYINGQLRGTAAPNRKLSDLVDVNNWLGRSNSTADKTFVGRINEVRIYDVPLSTAWVEALCGLGPDGEPKDPAVVNPCVNPLDPAFDLDGNCRVDLGDLVQFILQADDGWLSCGRLHGCF
ncbi:MAG: LamG domain-containing protein [Phycisphaerae bacterium]|nr:LamG domain-containing protein [Phycisphaerae bacterium]